MSNRTSLNMVANQGYLTKPKEQLVKLHKSKNGRYFTNTKEWSKALRTVFETHDLSIFITEDYGIKVPKEELSRALFEGEMKIAVEKSKNLTLDKKRAVVKHERVERSSGTGTEEVDGRDDTESPAPETPQKPKATLHSDTQRTELNLLNDRQKAFEEIVKQNAKRIAEKQKEIAAKDVEGSEVAIFVNPLTCVTPEQRDLYEPATIPIVVGGEKRFYECESKAYRLRRMTAWDLLKWTIPEVDSAVYERLSVGDVYTLYTSISTYLSKSNKSEQVKTSLAKELEKFSYRKGELFKTFVARYRQVRTEMEQVGYVVDTDILHTGIRKVIMRAGGAVEKAYLTALPQLDKDERDAMVILDAMTAQMEVLEKHGHLRREEDVEEEGEESSASDSDEEKRRERRRERNRKMREKKKKKKRERQEEDARVMRAQSSHDYSHVRGVCLFHQEGKCTRGDACSYEHRKLSTADTNTLREFMKQKQQDSKAASGKPPRTCFVCGKPGHIASSCPNRGAPTGGSGAAQPAAQVKLTKAQVVDALMAQLGGPEELLKACLSKQAKDEP